MSFIDFAKEGSLLVKTSQESRQQQSGYRLQSFLEVLKEEDERV